MFLVEAIIGLTILMVVLSVGLLLLKVAFSLVLLPFKLVFFLTKGLLGLLILVPLLLILGAVFTAVIPLGLVLFVVPVLVVGGVVSRLLGV